MLVYLMRHGIASPRGELGIDDSVRPLTIEGADKVRRICRALKKLKVSIDEVWASSLLRARQTADIVAETFGLTQGVRNVRELEPGGDLRALCEQLRGTHGLAGVLLAGHEPDMSELASTLISGRSEIAIRFKKGGVACIELDDLSRESWGQLLWLLGNGRTSSSVVSESGPAAAGVWLNETYWLSGVCLFRVAVFTAVMIWRVMQSSAKPRKLDSRSGR